VESVGPVVSVKAKGSEAPTTVALERVRTVVLANPSKPREGTLVWLADGSVIALAAPPESDGQSIKGTMRLGRAPFGAPLASVNAVALEAGRIRPLAALAPAEYKPASERRWTRPPHAVDAEATPLGAADI